MVEFSKTGVFVLLLLGVTSVGCAPQAFSDAMQLRLSQLGPVLIDADNNYAETVRYELQAVYTAPHPDAGEPITGLDAPISISESNTHIYDGLHGATELPQTLRLNNGRARFTLRSLARYPAPAARERGTPEIIVSVGPQSLRFPVEQWVDENADGQTDWLQQQVADLVARGLASDIPMIREVLDAVSAWKQSARADCGGVVPGSPTEVNVGLFCLNAEDENIHRFNAQQELAATLLHEARHVWAYRNPQRADLPPVYRRVPVGADSCDEPEPSRCVSDPQLDPEAVRIHERDAEAFAQRFKTLLSPPQRD